MNISGYIFKLRGLRRQCNPHEFGSKRFNNDSGTKRSIFLKVNVVKIRLSTALLQTYDCVHLQLYILELLVNKAVYIRASNPGCLNSDYISYNNLRIVLKL